MPRPTPTPLIHFTHVEHLPTIVHEGLLADTVAQARGLLTVEVGILGIKARRRTRVVPIAPGGFVADCAPFYYAPRSPMMFVIERGGVPTYSAGCNELVYLVTTVERLQALGLVTLFTDRNAVLAYASFTSDQAALDELIDWKLMRAHVWSDTPVELDRKERRMAECLAHQRVPWQAFTEVVTKTETCATAARAALATVGGPTPVVVRPGWYF